MKKTSPIIGLIAFALAFPSVLAANQTPATLVAADNVIVANGGEGRGKLIGYKDNKNVGYIGNTGSSDNMRNANVIIGFELSELGGLPEGATLAITNTGASKTAFRWAVQLYVFAPGVNARALGQGDTRSIHYADAKADPSPNVRLLTDKLMAQKTPQGAVTFDLSRHFRKGGALADFYGPDGKPLPGDRMIWFRLNQGEKPGDKAIRMNMDNTIGGAGSPTLVFDVK
jgi:hypothetical protein